MLVYYQNAEKKKNLEDGVNENGEDIGITGKFTDIFYETKGKILIEKSSYGKFKYNHEYDQLKIGIIGEFHDKVKYKESNSCSLTLGGNNKANTNITTSSFVKSVFRNASFFPVVNRYDAFNCLKSGDIDAFANDEILLPYILKKLEDEASKEDSFNEEFLIIPDIGGYTNEPYSIVVYGDSDDSLLKVINHWINSKEAENKLKNSISNFSSYISRYGYSINEDNQAYLFFNEPNWNYFYGLLAIALILLTLFVSIFVFIIRENKAKRAISRKEFNVLSENIKKINSKLSRVDFKSSIASKEAVAFISYSRKDIDRVTSIAEGLEQQGYSVWLDTKFVIGGDDFVDRIETGISSTKVTILFCSIHSVKSRWVIKETEITRDKGNVIIPVMLNSEEDIIKSSTNFSEELKLGYAQKIYMRNKKEEEAALIKIIESIDHNLSVDS